VHQEKSPSKNIYHITGRGRKEFMDWLAGSEDETDPIKYDFFMQYSFLMKCNFFEHLSRDDRIKKLRRQIETAGEKILEYERMREEMRERSLNDYKIRIVNFGIETQLLKIDWINDLLISELGKGARGAAKEKKLHSARKKRKATTGKG
jgi:DNA-binding PadR family transcriptional regulator